MYRSINVRWVRIDLVHAVVFRIDWSYYAQVMTAPLVQWRMSDR